MFKKLVSKVAIKTILSVLLILSINSAKAQLGIINGPSAICLGSSVTYTDTALGGKWFSSNTTVASIDSNTGYLTGVAYGTVIITYTRDTNFVTSSVSVDTIVSLDSILGVFNLCFGSSVTLTDSTTGGIWSVTNANASVSSVGVVEGLVAGTDSVVYTINNSCGTYFASVVVTINPLPIIDSILGTFSVCVASTMHLYDSTYFGVWSAANTNAHVDSSGFVIGDNAGIDTIYYTVSNTYCTANVSASITINPLPNAGVITGPSSVCQGNQITLSDVATGGIWSFTTGNTSIDTLGILTGVLAGADSILYTVSTVCGAATAYILITVNPLPSAGIISGSGLVCIGISDALTNTVSGGFWSSSADSIATIDSFGNVTGLSSGIIDISYTFTNVCGTAYSTFNISVNPMPYAGSISGTDSICIGATAIVLSASVTGGVWSAQNSNATISTGGLVTGTTVGADSIFYTVTNVCGSDVARFLVIVMDVPDPGSIIGLTDTVCVGSTITLSETLSSGIWSTQSGNASISTDGIVTGVTYGTDNVFYTVSNLCGHTYASYAVVIDQVPDAGSIICPSEVCPYVPTMISGSVAGGTWASSNPLVAYAMAGFLIGITPGTTTISYTVTNMCGSATATTTITVNPNPVASQPVGGTSVCIGSTIVLSASGIGGTWSEQNGNTYVVDGIVTGVIVGTDSVFYTMTNSCGSAKAGLLVSVNPLPTPVIYNAHDTLSTTVVYSSYQWYENGNPIPFATNYYYVATDSGSFTVKVINEFSCNATSSEFPYNGLSTPNILTLAKNINIFPNPTTNKLYIKSPVKTDAVITTPDGRLIIDSKGVSEIDVTNLPVGLYFITLYESSTGLKILTDRILKTN